MPTTAAAAGYYARKRRRIKQNQEAFALAGIEPAPFRIITLGVNVGGGGYAVGDEFLISGGTFSIQGRGYVAAEAAGVVTAVAIQIAGAYTVGPGAGAATVAQTGGGNDLLTVDVTISGPFDFGAMLIGQDSPNSLLLPADVNIAIGSTVALAAGVDVFIGDDLETWGFQTGIVAGGISDCPQYFKKDRTIVITRGDSAPSAVLEIFFRGPKSQLIKIGDCVFT